jgi:hypothetical protein
MNSMLDDLDDDDDPLIHATAAASPSQPRATPAATVTVSPPGNPIRTLDNLLSSDQLAELLGVHVTVPVHWRARGAGPRYIAVEGRVCYHPDDVLSYLNACLVEPSRPPSRVYRSRRRPACSAKQPAGKAAPGLS